MSFLGLGIGLALNDERGDSNTVDFSTFSVGTPLPAGVLPGGGSYTQAAGSGQAEETVQTSASTVARWAFVANLPRIGLLADGGIGLVLEPPRTNDQPRSDANHAEWVITSVTKAAVQGPDGIAGSAVEVTDSGGATGFISRPTNYTGGATYVSSVWVLSVSGAGGWGAGHNDGNPDDGIPIARAGFVSWARRVPAAYTALAGPVSSWSLIPAYTAAADVGVVRFWGNQREIGKYATNHIPTAGTTASRAGFRVSIPISRYVRGGTFRAVLTTVPHGAATEYDGDSATIRLWTIDANTYAEVNTSTRVLTVSVNGVARVAGVPLWWLRGHRVQWSWEVGNGNLRVRYRYSTDQGATWTLPFDPFGGTVYSDSAISTASSTIDLYSDSGSSKWWGTGVVSEDPILTAPAWALQWLPTDDANVKAWFRADGHYTLASGLVSAWQSQNTGVSASQGTGAFQPTFGAALVNSRPGLDFDGTNDSLAIAGLTVGSGDLLVSAALNIVATLGVDVGSILFDSLTGRVIATIRSTATTDNLGYYDNIAWRSVAVVPVTGAQVLTYDMRVSPGGRIYKDGVQQGSAQTYSAIGISGQTAIGSSYNNTGSWMRARLGDFVIASSQTDALRNNLHAFYALKYGLTVA